MTRQAANPLQDELPLDSIKSHAVFPGRLNLYVAEVASKLQVTNQHILNLIEAGEIDAINIAKDIKGGTTKSGRTKSEFWRIPVAAYDALIEARRNDRGA